MLRAKTAFRHQILHKRIVTSGTMTVNCLVQSLSSTEAKRQGSTVVTGGTSRDFTTRIEGRRKSSWYQIEAVVHPLLEAAVQSQLCLDPRSHRNARACSFAARLTRSDDLLQQGTRELALAQSADKRREVGKGLSLADTQTGC